MEDKQNQQQSVQQQNAKFQRTHEKIRGILRRHAAIQKENAALRSQVSQLTQQLKESQDATEFWRNALVEALYDAEDEQDKKQQASGGGNNDFQSALAETKEQPAQDAAKKGNVTHTVHAQIIKKNI